MDDINFVIRYKDQNIDYKLDSFLGCDLLKELYNMKRDLNEPIELNLYPDIFDIIYNKKQFTYDVDRDYDEKYDEKYYDEQQDKKIQYILEGLGYFGSDRLYNTLIEIKNIIYYNEKLKVQQKYVKLFCKESDDIKPSFWKNSIMPIEYFDIKNISLLAGNKSVPIQYFEENIKKFKENTWTTIAENTSIPVEFFDTYLDEFRNPDDWPYLSINSSIPPEFYEEYIDEVDFLSLMENTGVSLQFLEKHINEVEWSVLSVNPSIPVEFYEKHKDNYNDLNWEEISTNPNIPFDFFKEYIPIPPRRLFCLSPNTPIDFFEKYIDSYNDEDWSYLCSNTSIPIDFFEKYVNHEYFCWNTICNNPSIPLEFFKKHINKVKWNNLCSNPSIPIDFFEKHIKKVKPTIYKNNFSIYIENKVNSRLLKINPILINETIEINTIILNCLNILSNTKVHETLLFFSKLILPKYLILSNTANYSKNVFTQIKHFMCSIRNKTKYDEHVKEICDNIERKEILNELLYNT